MLLSIQSFIKVSAYLLKLPCLQAYGQMITNCNSISYSRIKPIFELVEDISNVSLNTRFYTSISFPKNQVGDADAYLFGWKE